MKTKIKTRTILSVRFKNIPQIMRMIFLTLFFAFATLTIISTSLELFSEPLYAASTSIKRVRVVWTENPSQKAAILWDTYGSYKSNIVYYDTKPHSEKLEDYSYSLKTKNNGKYTLLTLYNYHHAYLSDLKPSTTYYFVVVSGQKISKEHHFVTAPAPAPTPAELSNTSTSSSSSSSKFALFVGGDSRVTLTKRSERQHMNQLIHDKFEERPDILALVHGGDYTYLGFDWIEWKQWMDDHTQTTTADNRILPIIPIRGNHERSINLYNYVFGYPAYLNPSQGEGSDKSNNSTTTREHYYATTMGPLLLLNLNCELDMGGPERDWLEEQLKNARPQYPWVIANYHKPAWPAVKTPSEALTYWVPLFEKYGVNLAIESDGHVMKRTVPIFNNQRDDERGVIYVGEGGLGVPQRTPTNKDEWYLQAPGYATPSSHYQLITISPTSLIFEVYKSDATLFDHLEIFQKNKK